MQRQTRAQEAAARRLVDERSGGRCELMIPGVCRGWGESKHHRRPRGMGGTTAVDTASVLVAACGHGTAGCHGYAERNRTEGYDLGWLVPHDDSEPEDVPIWLYGRRRRVRLRLDGGVEVLPLRPLASGTVRT